MARRQGWLVVAGLALAYVGAAAGAGLLARRAAPGLAAGPSVPAVAYDGLSLRVGPGYARQPGTSCWASGRGWWPGGRWRRFCVSRLDGADVAARAWLEPRPPRPGASDQYRFEEWSIDTVSWGGRRAVVERARASGGLAGVDRERTLVVRFELAAGAWATLEGATSDDAGYAELLAVARTVAPSRPPTAPASRSGYLTSR